MGKLWKLRGTIECYYWSEDDEPDVVALSETLEQAMRDDVPLVGCGIEQATEAADDEMIDLVYGDHVGDLTVREALERQRADAEAAEAEAAYLARQQRLL